MSVPPNGMRKPSRLERLREGDAVLDDVLLQLLELIRLRQLEGHRLGQHRVDMRTALLAREDSPVDLARDGRLMGEDDRAARPAQRFVGGEGDDIGDPDRGGVDAGGDHPSHVGDVGHEVCPDRVCDLAEGLPIDGPGVGRVAGDDHLRSALFGQLPHPVVIDALGLGVDVVMHDVVELARAVHGGAVGEMPAVKQVHAHDSAAGFDQRVVDGVVGRGAGQGLHVDE